MRTPSTTRLKVRKEKATRRTFRVPKDFSYKPYGLRDPFSPPRRFYFGIGDVVGVLKEKGGFSILIRTPSGSLRMVGKGDTVEGFKVLDLRGDSVLLEKAFFTPWGGKKLVRKWVPLKVGGKR